MRLTLRYPEPSNWQLSMLKIFNRLSAFLSGVEDPLKLRIREPGPRYSPLREAVVSLMVSHRLSGRLIGVEYERLYANELGGTGTGFMSPQRQYHTLTCSEKDHFFNR